MEKILLKKSFQINNFKEINYNSLWGCKGIFTTIRLSGKTPKLILIENHIKKLNKDLKHFDINFTLTKNFLNVFLNKYSLIKNYNHLLRIAINKKIISLSLRKRISPEKIFTAKMINYQRVLPEYKNLQYKKIISLQKNINLQKEEIIFYNKKIILEGSTTNIIFAIDNKLVIPKQFYYYGITLTYLINKFKNIIQKKDITISSISNFTEIILVGSGKGVVSLSSIEELNWNRSSKKMYNLVNQKYLKLLNR